MIACSGLVANMIWYCLNQCEIFVFGHSFSKFVLRSTFQSEKSNFSPIERTYISKSSYFSTQRSLSVASSCVIQFENFKVSSNPNRIANLVKLKCNCIIFSSFFNLHNHNSSVHTLTRQYYTMGPRKKIMQHPSTSYSNNVQSGL